MEEMKMDGFAQKMVEGMVQGFGPNFPGLGELFAVRATREDIARLTSPLPPTGRYAKAGKFCWEITSDLAVSRLRFHVIIKYLIYLSKFMESHGCTGFIKPLSDSDIQELRKIGTTADEVMQAQFLEKFTEHDTAAAATLVKFLIAKNLPHLAGLIEAVHWANTSEGVMGNVFGMVGNQLLSQFLIRLIGFCECIIGYANLHEQNGPLVLPALTHEQAAEPSTLGKEFITSVFGILSPVESLLDVRSNLRPFTGNFGGAVGNLTCHYACYPELDWHAFAKQFVESFGLRYEPLAHQSVTYAREAQILVTLANILAEIQKFGMDFVKMASSPGQLFVKIPKPGRIGSSLMPQKGNFWGKEGAYEMLEMAIWHLLGTAGRLQKYPLAGNMGRSVLMRAIGWPFMWATIAMGRIERELTGSKPNPANIQQFFNEYPGMAGSSIQSFLKAQKIPGDAYRAIQTICIKADGFSANAPEFQERLEGVMNKFNLSDSAKQRLRKFLEPLILARPSWIRTQIELQKIQGEMSNYKHLAEKMAKNWPI
jgi:adenylosuccinate lyase